MKTEYGHPFNRNFVINGNFDVWQRGASYAPNSSAYIYTADRWKAALVSGSATHTLSLQTVTGMNASYILRYQRNNAATSTSAYIVQQPFETADSRLLIGKYVTFSFKLKKGALFTSPSVTARIKSGTGSDQGDVRTFTGAATVASTVILAADISSSEFTIFSVSSSVPIASTVNQLGVEFEVQGGVGTAGASDYIDISSVKLEEGTVVTPFTRYASTLAGEWETCYRYCFVANIGNNASLGPNVYNDGNNLDCIFTVPVVMRISSVATFNGTPNTDYSVISLATGATQAGFTFSFPGGNTRCHVRIRAFKSSHGLSTGSFFQLFNTGSLVVSAEL